MRTWSLRRKRCVWTMIPSLVVACGTSAGKLGESGQSIGPSEDIVLDMANSRFIDSSTSRVPGLRLTSGACAWSGSHTLSPGERRSLRLVAYNLATFEMIVARGTYTPRANQPGMKSSVSVVPVGHTSSAPGKKYRHSSKSLKNLALPD